MWYHFLENCPDFRFMAGAEAVETSLRARRGGNLLAQRTSRLHDQPTIGGLTVTPTQVRRFVLSISAAILFVGCSSDGGKSPPYYYGPSPEVQAPVVQPNIVVPPSAEETARTLVIAEVSQIESLLSNYGVRFEVKMSSEHPFDRDFAPKFGQEVVLVKITHADVTDQELVAIGKNPEERDKLFSRMNDLWPIIDSNKLEEGQKDNTLMIAVMKVNLVRRQVMLPKFLKSYRQVVALKMADDDLTLLRDEKSEVSLWKAEKTTLSNGEAIQVIDYRIAMNQNFETLKVTFLKPYISQVEKNLELSRDKESWRESLGGLREISEFQYLNALDEQMLLKLKENLTQAPPTALMDAKLLAQTNTATLNGRRAALVTELATLVQNEMDKLQLEFTQANGKIMIDQKSLTRARINGILTGRPKSHYDVVFGREKIKQFVEKYGKRSKTPENEAEVLHKADLFTGL